MDRKTPLEKALIYLAVLIVGLVFLFPLYIVLSSAFKSNLDMFARPPVWIFTPIWDNFIALFAVRRFQDNIWNSTVVALGSTVLSVFVGSMAAYALARLKHPRLKNVAFWILSIRMFPPIAVVIPYYILLRDIGLLDTPWALILVYSTGNIPLTVWLMKGFFEQVPETLEEAAQVDGHGVWTTFWRVTLPLAAPGIAVCAMFCFIFSWNEFLFAFMLTSSKTQTVTVAVMSFWSSDAIEWGRIMAGSIVIVIPVVIFVFACQRFLVKGLTMGSVK